MSASGDAEPVDDRPTPTDLIAVQPRRRHRVGFTTDQHRDARPAHAYCDRFPGDLHMDGHLARPPSSEPAVSPPADATTRGLCSNNCRPLLRARPAKGHEVACLALGWAGSQRQNVRRWSTPQPTYRPAARRDLLKSRRHVRVITYAGDRREVGLVPTPAAPT